MGMNDANNAGYWRRVRWSRIKKIMIKSIILFGHFLGSENVIVDDYLECMNECGK